MGDEKFTFSKTAEPADDDTCVAELWVAPISASDTHGRTVVDINIEYTAVFTEPIDLPLS